METVNTEELRLNLGEVLNRVQYQGVRIQITRRGRLCAMLVPIAATEVVSDPTAIITAAAGPSELKKSPGKSPDKIPKNPKRG